MPHGGVDVGNIDLRVQIVKPFQMIDANRGVGPCT